MSETQSETFSPRNITVLGGLLLLAVFIGEVVIGPHHEQVAMAEPEADPVEVMALRLKPVVTLGDILSGQSTSTVGDSGGAAVAAADSGPRTPEQLYQGACFACHGTGAAGAPKLGDAAAWSARAAQGIDTLVNHAINGIGAMPPKGGSQYDDEQIRVVVQYLLDNSQ